MALFIAMMNRSLVRSVATGETRASRRVYPPEQAEPAAGRGQADQGDRSRRRDLLRHGRPARRRGAAGGRGRELRDPRPAPRDDDRCVRRADARPAVERRRASTATRLLLAHISATEPLGRAVQGGRRVHRNASCRTGSSTATARSNGRSASCSRRRTSPTRTSEIRDRRVRADGRPVADGARFHEAVSRPAAASGARAAVPRRADRATACICSRAARSASSPRTRRRTAGTGAS